MLLSFAALALQISSPAWADLDERRFQLLLAGLDLMSQQLLNESVENASFNNTCLGSLTRWVEALDTGEVARLHRLRATSQNADIQKELSAAVSEQRSRIRLGSIVAGASAQRCSAFAGYASQRASYMELERDVLAALERAESQ